jgi:hypothetical protein
METVQGSAVRFETERWVKSLNNIDNGADEPPICGQQVTVDQFKNISGKQWRVREGNEDGPRVAPGYDPLEAFVRRV